jgi:hypothetical protein
VAAATIQDADRNGSQINFIKFRTLGSLAASGDSHSSSAAAARAKVGSRAGHISRARNYGFMDRNLPCQFTVLPARDFAKPQARIARRRHES